MAITLDSMVKSGLIIAFIIPIFTYISITMPPPTPIFGNTSSTINITASYSNSASYIRNEFLDLSVKSNNSINQLALPSNSSGGFFSSAIQYEAFAFILNGFGQMIQDIIQIPKLDSAALNMFSTGLSAVLPGFLSTAIAGGIGLMQAYLTFSLLMTGLGMLMKYNPKVS